MGIDFCRGIFKNTLCEIKRVKRSELPRGRLSNASEHFLLSPGLCCAPPRPGSSSHIWSYILTTCTHLSPAPVGRKCMRGLSPASVGLRYVQLRQLKQLRQLRHTLAPPQLTDFSQVDSPGLKIQSVNLGAETIPGSTNW